MPETTRKHQPFEWDPHDGAERNPTAEICRLRAIIRSQNEALMHWRRESDRDSGKIARYAATLLRITEAKDLDEARLLASEALIGERLCAQNRS